MSEAAAIPSAQDASVAANEQALPVIRLPMLDSKRELFAYEIVFQDDAEDEATLMRRALATITDGALARLVRGNRTFLRLSHELLMEETDVLQHQPRFGVLLRPEAAADAALVERLARMAQRGCPLMLDAGDTTLEFNPAVEPLLKIVQFVRLDASKLDPATLRSRSEYLHARGTHVVAGHVDDHDTYHRCESLPLQAIQGQFLLKPEPVAVPVLAASRLSLLRLMKALQEGNPGPVELGQIVRDDAILSYKLLGCVNSAYFALPRQLKSVQQAAIFFGAARLRNWIYTMALSGTGDRPPELLRAALIRAHMCEKLAQHMPAEQREMAFTAGLFSLLDAMMEAPMDFVLWHLPLAREISTALLENKGPFAILLEQIRAWEAGNLRGGEVQPQLIRRMAAIYLEATQWADHVYAFADQRPN
ncbi:EAL and HDOD domain-containing protein [Dyella kyungheensis]|jgi:EAL and modified HD-GYP domain-containing signal transduction protein|uniref:HDOD domain-containing protein n=1 Tax=Dyella kyungheensis TaxID=1242174 RepID=A0ABS2JUA2_9GAMM|nr:HDOD domain-containing protein [Dyella kyungheensis]MBM7122446.1 HDOD domain-containing protein [Dyella kyungheensis]